MGEKLSIVTSRPQTTRHRVLGSAQSPRRPARFRRYARPASGRESRAQSRDESHRGRLRSPMRTWWYSWSRRCASARKTHAVLQRIRDSGRDPSRSSTRSTRSIRRINCCPTWRSSSGLHGFLDVVPVSAEKGVNLDRLIEVIFVAAAGVTRAVPARAAHRSRRRFPDLRDHPREAHHGAGRGSCPTALRSRSRRRARKTGSWSSTPSSGSIAPVRSPSSSVPRASRLKRIGQQAREELNARLGKRLHLNLWVKVREDWADDARALAQLGME